MSHSDNIKRTLEAMFGQKTNKTGIFRKSQGMQFARPGATFVWLFLIFAIVGAGFAFFKGAFLLGALLLIISPILAAYVIDIQGFEVDFKNDKIRKYRSFLGLNSGEWLPLSSFDSVRVYQHQLKTQRGVLSKMARKDRDTHTYYYVRIVSPGLKKSISLLELNDYSRAKHQAEKVAYAARLRFVEKPARLKEDKV